jgi:hypothetical protein
MYAFLYIPSVPLQESEVTVLQAALETPATTFTDFRKGLSGKRPQDEPREFRTPRRVIALIGQPQGSSNNLEFEEAAKAGVDRIFFNSDLVWYPFRHAGDLDYLLVFVVDPFLPVVVNSMFDYVARTWVRDTSKGHLLANYVRGEIERQSVDDQLFREDEIAHLPASPIGSATIASIGTAVMIPFGPDIVLSALDKLKSVLSWKKVSSPRM